LRLAESPQAVIDPDRRTGDLRSGSFRLLDVDRQARVRLPVCGEDRAPQPRADRRYTGCADIGGRSATLAAGR